MKRSLHIVTDECVPVDIYKRLAEEISARNWDAVHIIGDRRSAIDLPDVRKGWRR